MRSGSTPDMDTMTQLYLHAVRSGMTDMALLLARQVPDLTTQNTWGENALTMAAMMVSGVSCGGPLPAVCLGGLMGPLLHWGSSNDY